MRELLDFFRNKSYFLVFLLLQGIALTMVIRSDQSRHDIFQYNTTQALNSVKLQKAKWSSFWQLSQKNRELSQKNSDLTQELKRLQYTNLQVKSPFDSRDSIHLYLPAVVIDNDASSFRNFLLLEGGADRGAAAGDGVITSKGIVGIIYAVSDGYSKVISCLHKDQRIGASIQSMSYFGYLQWDGKDSQHLQLHGIPRQTSIRVGDTVVTKNTRTFPYQHPVGTISKVTIPSGSDFYLCEIKLFQDPRDVDHVMIYHHQDANEIDSLSEKNYY